MRAGASLHLWTEADGSTRYTVDMGAGGGSAHCSAYEHRTPILGLWHAGADVMIAPAGDTHVSDAELRFAQDLADMAADYLAACQRFHTPETNDPDRAGDAETKSGRVA